MTSKKAIKEKDEEAYELRDLVLAKIRGFPPWPAMIVDPEGVPKKVLKERPHNSKLNFHCVRFFPAGDYSWALGRDLTRLPRSKIETFLNGERKKKGELYSGYQIALDPTEWETEHAVSTDDVDMDGDSAEVDELDDADGKNGTAKKGAAKKRKRSESAAPKAKKGSEPPAAKKKVGRGRKNGVQSKEVVESEDDGEGEEGTERPASKKTRKSKEDGDAGAGASKVKEWRHKLQRAFLGKTPLTSESDLAEHDKLFKQVEDYNDINLKQLQSSKIGKVMRHIANVKDLPGEEQYKFRERALRLVDRWQLILKNDPDGEAKADETKSPVSPAKDDDEAPLTAMAVDAEKSVAGDAAQTNGIDEPATPAAEETTTAEEAMMDTGE